MILLKVIDDALCDRSIDEMWEYLDLKVASNLGFSILLSIGSYSHGKNHLQSRFMYCFPFNAMHLAMPLCMNIETLMSPARLRWSKGQSPICQCINGLLLHHATLTDKQWVMCVLVHVYACKHVCVCLCVVYCVIFFFIMNALIEASHSSLRVLPSPISNLLFVDDFLICVDGCFLRYLVEHWPFKLQPLLRPEESANYGKEKDVVTFVVNEFTRLSVKGKWHSALFIPTTIPMSLQISQREFLFSFRLLSTFVYVWHVTWLDYTLTETRLIVKGKWHSTLFPSFLYHRPITLQIP